MGSKYSIGKILVGRHGVMVVLLVLGFTCCVTLTAMAQETRLVVLGEDRAQLASGEVEFFRGDYLVTRLVIGAGGEIILDRGLLEEGATYQISILNEDLVEIYRTQAWVYNSGDFDPVLDDEVGIEQYILNPVIQGQAGTGLDFRVDREVNPAWEQARADQVEEETIQGLFGPPKFLFSLSGVFMLGGGFGTDESAGGGVTGVSPGIGAALSIRSGYPESPELGEWVGFREITLGGAFNAYETNQILSPGEKSDVTFLRFFASYGIGRMKGGSHMSAALALAYGGIYDGSNTLEYLGTSYSMFGAGITGKYLLRIIGDGGMDVGLQGQLSLMYYPGDDRVHWKGLAPSLAVGVVIY